jgi:putative ABC transport system permease protein
MKISDLVSFSLHALRANRVRTLLTSLGMLIGNASVILVVTISLTGREYILEQIRAVGSNMVYAYYEAGSRTSVQVDADFVKWSDVLAVRQQFGNEIIAATGIMRSYDRVRVNGDEQDLRLIGSDEIYPRVRNLEIVAGRFMTPQEVASRAKVVMLTDDFARKLCGAEAACIGKKIRLKGLQFTIIGAFREKTETFGISELGSETALIPVSVLRYFMPVESVHRLFVQVRTPEDVLPMTRKLRVLLEGRHRPGARYAVQNLTAILAAAENIALALTVVLLVIAAIALVISGIGIMNIMLVTVTERTKEIGIRMAIGASRRAVRQQFLLEAMLLSLIGGLAGIVVGVSIPLSVTLFVEGIAVPVSYLSILIAFLTSCSVGLLFGYLPASRASSLNPTEALHYE